MGTAAYYLCRVIKMQKHWQNSFTAIENCVTQIITSMRVHTHTRTRLKAVGLARGGKRECNLAPRLKSLLNCSARTHTCWLVQQRLAVLKNMSSDCFLHCWFVCSGVHDENRTSVQLIPPAYWSGIIWCFHYGKKALALAASCNNNDSGKRCGITFRVLRWTVEILTAN